MATPRHCWLAMDGTTGYFSSIAGNEASKIYQDRSQENEIRTGANNRVYMRRESCIYIFRYRGIDKATVPKNACKTQST